MVKNEKGQALVFTLIIIVIILLFSTTLLALTLNSRTLVKKSETYVQETEVAEMGIVFFKEKLMQSISKINEDIRNDQNVKLADLANKLATSIRTLDQKSVQVVDNKLMYTLTVPLVELLPNTNTIVVTVKSTGKKIGHSSERALTARYELVGEGVGGNSAFETKEEFSKINNPSRLMFTYPDEDKVHTSSIVGGNCNYPLYAEFNQYSELTNSCNHLSNGSMKFNGSVAVNPNTNLSVSRNIQFANFLTFNGNKLDVGKNAIFKGSVEFKPSSSLIIGNNAIFNQNADFGSSTNISIGGNALFNNAISIGERSELKIAGELYSANDLKFYKYSTTKIGGDVRIPTATFFDNSTLNIDGNFLMTNDANIQGKNVQITIGKSASCTTITIGAGSTLHVKGNFFSSKWLTVNGKICVEGKAFLVSKQTVTRANSCPKNQPDGTIYELGKPVIGNNPFVLIKLPDEEIKYK
ncbi:hypothetical protein KHA93_09165 [Bacillus sp. FJAT-49732]|uniref:Uncharacterized protein n=1 Tax=Lederbergia citrisecunda TaxID=2833583 RepID=A0A942TKF2_9BACI|nr:hypothetical protein [Lederbergia citrisecunda]MBS4199826.1 hypothetical protein [Lederbergia citrisecunda]